MMGEIPILAKQSFMQVPNPPGSSDALIRKRGQVRWSRTQGIEAGLFKRQLWSGRRIHV